MWGIAASTSGAGWQSRMPFWLKPQFLSVYDETAGPGTATRQDFGVVSVYTAAAA